MTALRRSPLQVVAAPLAGRLLPVGAGVLLGALALADELRPKTSTELAIGAVVVALVCVLAGNPRRLLLVAVVFDIPLEWGKDLFWNATLANQGATAGLQISITTFALLGLYAMWVFEWRPNGAGRVWLRPALPLISYVGFAVLSLLVATNRVLSLYQTAELAQTLLLFIYIVNRVRTREEVNFLVTAILAGLVVESLLMLYIHATGSQFRFLGLANRSDLGTFGSRVGGTVGSPNTAAAYLCLTLSLALGVLAAPATRTQRRLALLALPLGTVSLIETGSRGGWIAFAVAAVIMTLWAVRRRLVDGRTALVAAIAIVALLLPFAGTIAQRATGNDNGSAASRVTMAKLASEIIRDHPVLGVGVNNAPVVIPRYVGPQYLGQFIYSIHDKYLLVWAETGIGGLLALLWFLGATLRRGWRCAALRDPLLAALAAAIAAGIAGQMIHMGVDIFASKPQDEGLWLMAALLVVIERISARERRAQTPR